MNPNTNDPRGRKPSCSSLHRLFSCPGSFRLEQLYTDETPSAAALAGTALHTHMEHGTDPEDLADLEAVQWCRTHEANLVATYLPEANACIRERRLWDRDNTFSGQADAIYRDDHGNYLVIDYKFGRGHVEPAAENHQLAGLALLVKDNITEPLFQDAAKIKVYAAILQPSAGGFPEVAVYTGADLEGVRNTITDAIWAAMQDGADLEPSEHACKYCRARGACPALRQEVERAQELATRMPWDELAPERKAALLDAAALATTFADEIKERAKRDLTEGREIPGYRLKPGAKTYTVTDFTKAFCAMQDAFPAMSAERFASCCKVSMTPLYKLAYDLRKEAGEKTTQKEAKELVQDLLSFCSEVKEKTPTLEKYREA